MPFKISLSIIALLALQACNGNYQSNVTLDELNRTSADPDPKSGGLFSGEKGYFEITPDDFS